MILNPYLFSIANSGSIVFQDGFETVSTTSFSAATGQTVTLFGADSGNATAKYGSGSLYCAPSEYATVPDSGDWDFGGDDFTIQLWYRPDEGYYAFSRALIQSDSTVGVRGWVFNWSTAGANELRFLAYDGTTPTTLGAGVTATPTAGTWYHVAVCRQGGTLRLYRDGVQTATIAIAHDVNGSTEPLVIGARWSAGSPVANTYARGRFDDVQIIKGYCLYPDGTTFTPPGELPPP